MKTEKKNFKIAVVLQDLLISGTVLCTMGYVRFLVNFGYDVTLIVIESKIIEIDIEGLKGLNLILFSDPIPLRILSETMDKFDAVIISNGGHFLFALEASRFTHKPIIVELLHANVKAGQSPSVDMTIAVSEHVFREMQPRENDLFIPNGVDISEFIPPKRKKKSRVTLIQIARPSKVVNPDLSVLAPGLLNEGLPIEAYIVGRDGLSTEYIKYCGLQQYKNIPSLLQNSDILLHMPAFEGFGLTAIEAMAVGTIPIVSNVGGLPNSVEHAKTGYVIPHGDTNKVKSIIRELVYKILQDHPDISAMRRNAIRRVHRNFNLYKTIKQVGGIN